jgi:hypothetical protein
MERGEDQVAGVRGLERGIQGLEVANLTDEDDVRVLPQHAAQRLAERRRVRADFTLVDVAVDVAMEEFDGILDRDHVRLVMLVDVLDHRGQRRRLPRPRDARDENQTARLQRHLFEHLGQQQLFERARLIRNRAHREAQRPALLIQVDAKPADAGHADGEVAFLFFRVLLDLLGVHELLGEPLQVFRLERGELQRMQVAVEADGGWTADLQVQVRRVELHQLLHHGLEIQAADGVGHALGRWNCRLTRHWDRSGRGPARIPRAGHPGRGSPSRRPRTRTRARS